MQQAIAAMRSRPKQLPMPSKRQSVMARSPEAERRRRRDSDNGESRLGVADSG